jgi:DeoR/GlpR family transcriptional regulator of sugar metabolism
LNREQRLRETRERVEGRRTSIVEYVREKGVVTPGKIAETLNIVRSTLSVDMVALRSEGRLQFHLGYPGYLEIAPEKEK